MKQTTFEILIDHMDDLEANIKVCDSIHVSGCLCGSIASDSLAVLKWVLSMENDEES